MVGKKIYRSSQGKSVDLGALLLQNEQVRAVGNMGVNARGDRINIQNKVIDRKNKISQRAYNKQIGPQDVQPNPSPDAIENVISTINNIKKSNQNLITVIGCGGDRDKDKRPIMGKISTDLSSRVIFTSDNPRSEDPQSIIDDMVQGVSNFNNDKFLIEVERKKAIRQAKENSVKGDIVLIAGKGHEDYQELNNKERIYFDDFKIAKEIFNK